MYSCEARFSENDEMRQERGVDLHMLFHRHAWRHHSREYLAQRFKRFSSGQWLELIRVCVVNEEEGLNIAWRRSRRQGQDGSARRAERANQFVRLGEISSARQVLESAGLAS